MIVECECEFACEFEGNSVELVDDYSSAKTFPRVSWPLSKTATSCEKAFWQLGQCFIYLLCCSDFKEQQSPVCIFNSCIYCCWLAWDSFWLSFIWHICVDVARQDGYEKMLQLLVVGSFVSASGGGSIHYRNKSANFVQLIKCVAQR